MADDIFKDIETTETTAPAAAAAASASAEAPAEAGGKKKAPLRRGGKKKVEKRVANGRAYVHASYNNTIVTLTDAAGNVLGWSSAGVVGFTGPKKATPYAASVIVKDVCDKVKDVGLKEVMVYVKGIGSGREAAVRALHANGIAVSSIKDVTPIPHNGCRAPKQRRV